MPFFFFSYVLGCETNFISCLDLAPGELKNALQTYQFTYANRMNSQYGLNEASFVTQKKKKKSIFYDIVKSLSL